MTMSKTHKPYYPEFVIMSNHHECSFLFPLFLPHPLTGVVEVNKMTSSTAGGHNNLHDIPCQNIFVENVFFTMNRFILLTPSLS
jgi:hypothetical protein